MNWFPADLREVARAIVATHASPARLSRAEAAPAVLAARAATLDLSWRMIDRLGVTTRVSTSSQQSQRAGERTALAWLARSTSAPVSSLGLLARSETALARHEPHQHTTWSPRVGGGSDYEHRWAQVHRTAAIAAESFAMLVTGTALRVAEIQRTCGMLTMGLRLGAAVLPPEEADRCAALAAATETAARAESQIRSTTAADDTTPVSEQLHHMLRYLARVHATYRNHLHHPSQRVQAELGPLARAFSDSAPALIRAATLATYHHLQQQTWGTTVGDSDLAVQPYDNDHPPRLLTALHHASSLAPPPTNTTGRPWVSTQPRVDDILKPLALGSPPEHVTDLDRPGVRPAALWGPDPRLRRFLERARHEPAPPPAAPPLPPLTGTDDMNAHPTATYELGLHL